MTSVDPEKTLHMVHDEDVEEARHTHHDDHTASVKHGDRALAIVGDDRVELTEEDVCFHLSLLGPRLEG